LYILRDIKMKRNILFFFLLIQIIVGKKINELPIHKIGIKDVSDIFQKDGALAITNLPEDYRNAVKNLQENSPDCLNSNHVPEFLLPDQSTRRTMALHSEDSSFKLPECIKADFEKVQKYFSQIDAQITAKITEVFGKENTIWLHEEGSGDLSDQIYKDHLHVYQRSLTQNESSMNNFALPYHKDNGLILYLTPFSSHSLLIKDKNGNAIETHQLEINSIIVLLGSGLSDWLLEGVKPKLHAPFHGVLSLPDSLKTRTTMARMKVLPDTAFSKSKSGKSFGDFFMGSTRDNARLGAVNLAWTELQEAQCNEGYAYCWMDCYELPEDCKLSESECITYDDKQCCTEDITENCENMNDECHWSCQATTPAQTSTSSQSSISTSSQSSTTTTTKDDKKFCDGGTDMYMQGFSLASRKNICVILLFESWVLDTKTKFIIGCIGVVILGIAIEGLLALRRNLQSRKILLKMSSLMRRVLIILLFGVNVACGYFGMLVAMTYSVELFLCMVIGLLLGHAIFNSEAEIGESVDPCCASQTLPHNVKSEKEMVSDL